MSALSPRFSPSGDALVCLSHDAAVRSGVHAATAELIKIPWDSAGSTHSIHLSLSLSLSLSLTHTHTHTHSFGFLVIVCVCVCVCSVVCSGPVRVSVGVDAPARMQVWCAHALVHAPAHACAHADACICGCTWAWVRMRVSLQVHVTGMHRRMREGIACAYTSSFVYVGSQQSAASCFHHVMGKEFIGRSPGKS